MRANSPNIHRDRSAEVDEGTVLAAVEHILGRRPVALHARETVAPRFVWEARFGDGPAVYVKAERDAGDDAALVLEAWALERVRALGVRAPAVMALDIGQAVFPGPLLVLENVRGMPLAPVFRERAAGEADLTVTQLAAVWRDVGRQLRLIHSIEVPGYGRLDDARYLRTGEIRGELDSWPAYTLPPAFAALNDATFLPRDLARRTHRALDDYSVLFDACTRPQLLHSDLGAKHIFVEPRTATLTGIIDWGDREAGDPAWDLANIALWENEERLGWALEGYDGDTEALRLPILISSIADGLRIKRRLFAAGRDPGARLAMAWLTERLRSLSGG